MSLRVATTADIPDIMKMCHGCHQEVPYETFPVNEEKAEASIQEYILEENRLVLLAEDEEGSFGVLIGFAAPLFYSDSYQAYELLWWVKPEKRKKKDAVRLFLAYEYWAKKLGCRSIQTSMVHGWPELEEFYTRRGYMKTETSFRKVLWESK